MLAFRKKIQNKNINNVKKNISKQILLKKYRDALIKNYKYFIYQKNKNIKNINNLESKPNDNPTLNLLNDLANKNQPLFHNPIEIHNVINYINFKYEEKVANSYNPNENNKKVLFLIAGHVNTELKLNNIKTLVNLLKFNCIDFKIANSENLPFNNELNMFCNSHNIPFYEVPNNAAMDFGKWNNLLSTTNYLEYSYVFFTNDSFITTDSIKHFVNLALNSNVELYGYNDSSEINYHYQSYLFAIKNEAIFKFINLVNEYSNTIEDQFDLINKCEVQLPNYFNNHSCYLKIANISFNKGINIFFRNDYLYEMLKNTSVLPFIKVKRLNYN